MYIHDCAIETPVLTETSAALLYNRSSALLHPSLSLPASRSVGTVTGEVFMIFIVAY